MCLPWCFSSFSPEPSNHCIISWTIQPLYYLLSNPTIVISFNTQIFIKRLIQICTKKEEEKTYSQKILVIGANPNTLLTDYVLKGPGLLKVSGIKQKISLKISLIYRKMSSWQWFCRAKNNLLPFQTTLFLLSICSVFEKNEEEKKLNSYGLKCSIANPGSKGSRTFQSLFFAEREKHRPKSSENHS